MEAQLVNIILVGIAFMILFIPFQTTSLIAVLYYFRFLSVASTDNLFLFLSAKCVGRSEK
jgi:hypothetical protein